MAQSGGGAERQCGIEDPLGHGVVVRPHARVERQRE
jgi:hypothetical protein